MTRPYEGKRIGVLMGGKSGEREVSLRSGGGVLESLQKQGYDAVGIDVNENVDERLREEKVEVAMIMLHGLGGEDGAIQGLLETMEIPYTGSGVTASALAMDKELTKLVIGQHGLPMPQTVYLRKGDSASQLTAEVEEKIGYPVMLKPAAEGSSLGCAIVKKGQDLQSEIEKLIKNYACSVAETFVTGVDLTVGVLGKRGEERGLPVLQMISKNEFYDYEAKYTEGMTELVCPARISDEMAAEAKELSIKAHRALGCYGVSRVDFVGVPETGELLILEVNTIPGMTVTSDLPREAVAEGGSYDSLVLEILSTATLER